MIWTPNLKCQAAPSRVGMVDGPLHTIVPESGAGVMDREAEERGHRKRPEPEHPRARSL